jgi:hypothetical protein
MYSYYIPIIEWNCEPESESFYNKHYQNLILYKFNCIIFISKRLSFNWLKKWKLGIKQFYCQTDDDCCEQYDFSNLSIKSFWIGSKKNILKFSNDVEKIIYLNNILDISKLRDLKNLKQYNIYNCKFSNYEKFYSDILFDKLIIDQDYSFRKYLIDIIVDIDLQATIIFKYYDNLDYGEKRFFNKQLLKIKKNNFCSVKYIILKNVEMDYTYSFLKFFSKLDRLDLIGTDYYRAPLTLKNIILNNVNLYTLIIEDYSNNVLLSLQSREEILNYFN